MAVSSCYPLASIKLLFGKAHSKNVMADFALTLLSSPVSRSHQTLLAYPPRGAATRDESPLQPEADVDRLNITDLLDHEPDATIRHRLFRYFGSSILAANDVGK